MPLWFWLLIVALVLLLLLLWVSGAFRRSKEAWKEAEAGPTTHEAQAEVPTAEAAASVQEDDLKVIEGIGPKLEQVLKEAGIRTYRDLATKTPEELRAILDAAGVARISNPQTWPEQAKLAAEGKWEELKRLQETLKGGAHRE